MTASPVLVGTLGMAALFVLIAVRVPIGIALIAVGVGGFSLQLGWEPALTILANEPSQALSSVELATVPLFLLMGTFATIAGFSADIFDAAAALLGRRRGSLSYATVAGSAAFGAVCGSSTATAATFTKIALPEMLRRNYDSAYAAGAVAAGGALKALIPPSLVMILYCLAANTFILDMFKASILPAMLIILLNLAAIGVMTSLNPAAFPIGPDLARDHKIAALKRALPAVCLLMLIFGGLYSGIFTVNEAASVAAIVALAFAIGRRKLSFRSFLSGLQETAGVTVMLYVMVIGANVFTYFMTVARVPDEMVALIGSLPLPALLTVVLMMVFYLVLGSVFDEIAAMLITLPFALPVVVHLGFDPLWWGVVNVVIIELGLIIPPVGMIVFIIHGMVPSISLSKIYKGVTPFIIADLILLGMLTLVPGLATWLPKYLGN